MTSRHFGLAAAFLFGGLGLAGCSGYNLAQAGAAPLDLTSAPPPGQAKICIVRPQTKIFSFTALVRDNGHLVGATRGQSYFCYLAEPGDHLISTAAERDTAEAQAHVAAGKSYYMEQYIDNGFQKMNIVQEWLPQEQATAEARNCCYLTLAGVPHNEVRPQIGAVVPALPGSGPSSLRSSLPSQGG